MKKKDIENKFEMYLPPSYLETIHQSQLNNTILKSLLTKRKRIIKSLENLDVEIEKTSHKRQLLHNQTTYIKKKYLPKIYYKQYYKKNQSTLFSHIVIKYHLISRTVYFGKIDKLINKFSNLNLSLDHNNFKSKIFPLLYPKVLDFLSSIKNESEFLNLNIKSNNLISFVLDNKVDDNNEKDISLLDYIKSLE